MAQPKAKSNSVVTSEWDIDTGLLTIVVLGKGGGKIVFDVRKFAGEDAYDELTDNGKHGLLHGVNQRIGNKTAISKDPLTGQAATPAEKFEAMQSIVEHFENGGEWKMGGNGVRPINRAALYEAIAVVRGRPVEEVEAKFRDKEDIVLKTYLTIADVAAEYVRRTKRGVDSAKVDEMFAELDEAE